MGIPEHRYWYCLVIGTTSSLKTKNAGKNIGENEVYNVLLFT